MSDAFVQAILDQEAAWEQQYQQALAESETALASSKLQGEEAHVKLIEKAKVEAHELLEKSATKTQKKIQAIVKKGESLLPSLQVSQKRVDTIAQKILQEILPELSE